MIVNLTLNSPKENFSFFYNEGVPLRGIKNLIGIAETITGETATRFFFKEYRYAMNGLRFTKWIEYTNDTDFVNEIQGGATTDLPLDNDLRIEFRYTRTGADTTGTLTLDEIIINGLFHTQYIQRLDFENTVFRDLAFTDDYLNKVYVNLIEKLYKSGVMPEYVYRDDNDLEDDDYIDFIKTISMWWAMHISLVDYVVTKMDQDKRLLSRYLEQRNLFLFGDESITRLQFFADNIYDEIRKRGTRNIHFIDGTFDSPVTEPKHGELTRIIGHDVEIDEYLWEFFNPAWIIEKSSPSTFNCIGHNQINKTPENTSDFVDLTKFQLFTGVTIVADGTKNVAEISAGSKLVTNPVKISKNIAYSVYLSFRCENPNALRINFIVTDRYGASRNLVESDTGNIQNEMVNGVGINNGLYFEFAGHIFERGRAALTAAEADNRFGGKHLTFSEIDTNRLSIEIENVSGGYLRIHDFKLLPYENTKGGIYLNGIYQNNIWLKNNNTAMTDRNLENNITEYLIPLDSSLNINEV